MIPIRLVHCLAVCHALVFNWAADCRFGTSLIERFERFETQLILEHANEHLLVHLVCGRCFNDPADLLEAFQEITGRPLAAKHPQTMGQALCQVDVVVCCFPEVENLQDVLPGQAGGENRQHIHLLNFFPRQAVGYLHEVLKGDVFQTLAAGHFPLTVVHT